MGFTPVKGLPLSWNVAYWINSWNWINHEGTLYTRIKLLSLRKKNGLSYPAVFIMNIYIQMALNKFTHLVTNQKKLTRPNGSNIPRSISSVMLKCNDPTYSLIGPALPFCRLLAIAAALFFSAFKSYTIKECYDTSLNNKFSHL